MWLSKGLLGLSAQANSIEDLSSYINNFRESKLAPLWTFIQNNVTTTISFNQMSGPILLQLENLGSLVELYLGGNYFSGTIPSTLSMCLDPHHVYCVCVFCFFFFSFLFFSFFFMHFALGRGQLLLYSRMVTVLFTHCSNTVHVFKNIKNRSHDTIHTFKNYFATVFSVFSFQFQQK